MLLRFLPAVFLCCVIQAQTDAQHPLLRQALEVSREQTMLIPAGSTRSELLSRVLELEIRAGFLREAETTNKLIPKSGLPPWIASYWAPAYAYYEGPERATQFMLTHAGTPDERAYAHLQLGKTYWRLGNKSQAEANYRRAGEISARMLPVSKRTLFQSNLKQLIAALDDPLPEALQFGKPPSSNLSEPNPDLDFPYTLEGFSKPDPASAQALQAEMAPRLTQLVQQLAAGNLAAFRQFIEGDYPPRQRAFVCATGIHMLAGVERLDVADMLVDSMPEDRGELSLVKAETLGYIAGVHGRRGIQEPLRRRVAEAIKMVGSVENTPPYVRARALSAIGVRLKGVQAAEVVAVPFHSAIELAEAMPVDPARKAPPRGRSKPVIDRVTVLEEVLDAQIRAGRGEEAVATARMVLQLNHDSAYTVFSDLVRGKRQQEALDILDVVRAGEPRARAATTLAQHIADASGIPSF